MRFQNLPKMNWNLKRRPTSIVDLAAMRSVSNNAFCNHGRRVAAIIIRLECLLIVVEQIPDYLFVLVRHVRNVFLSLF